ncbi:hypothetical protein C475_13952 [Halosimplex carlsbadense 2-9-1]|uniref:Uncharacterized protein n=1 Tax=Halosimplex carlsbadense 2-9-1 TaxID=797114 RepID=M0CNY9_9EURY|nr:hypothetical protein [Halosimplex carlsbadense]ELZ24358.1 hypothetical protein C475_13952 [Halosimplex carlsbadense 2-9-1]
MSQTPVDGSDREGRTVGDPDRGTEPDSLVSRFAARLRSVGRSLRARLRSLAGHEERSAFERAQAVDEAETTDRARSVQCVGLTEEVVEGDGRAVTDDLVRAQAAEAPDRDGPSEDRPELVVKWTDDELTLSSPDEPDAHITSTYWEDVEP